MGLQGELTPIRTQLVRSAQEDGYLDENHPAFLESILSRFCPPLLECCMLEFNSRVKDDLHSSLLEHKKVAQVLEQIHQLMLSITANLAEKMRVIGNVQSYLHEDAQMILIRWEKLVIDFKDPKSGTFNISKVPDIFDCAKYDSLYNLDLCGSEVTNLFKIISDVSNHVVHQEYGQSAEEKILIAHGYASPLIEKILADLHANIHLTDSK